MVVQRHAPWHNKFIYNPWTKGNGNGKGRNDDDDLWHGYPPLPRGQPSYQPSNGTFGSGWWGNRKGRPM
eukprot:1342207-Pyramimonas_sp.AAC.1